MKVLHVNTYNTGGAAKACLRLHAGLRAKEGMESSVLLLYKTIDQECVVSFWTYTSNPFLKLLKFIQSLALKFWQRKKINKLKQAGELFSFPESSWDIALHPLVKEADIIHLHWVSGFIDYTSFFANCKKPIVWTLHDFNPFSEGFHYPVDSRYFELVNQLGLNAEEIKYKAVVNNKLHIVTPSRYLAEASSRSIVFRNQTHQVIANGLDVNIYHYKNQVEARHNLSLPIGKKIILFIADNINYKRKGFSLFAEAIAMIKEDFLLCIVGGSVGKIQINTKELIELGYVSDDYKLSQIYAAADIFVCPSLADNLPNTIMESLCCGTPVVSFKVGGIPEMVQHELNGFLANEINVNQLKVAIEKGLHIQFDRLQIANESIKKYNFTSQIEKYMTLYNSILHPGI